MTKELKLAAARVKAFVAGHGALSIGDLEALADHALVAPSAAKPDADGWISWAGGECPVAEGVLVDCRYRNGTEASMQPALGEFCDAGRAFWCFDGVGVDIVAYRLSPQADVKSPDTPS